MAKVSKDMLIGQLLQIDANIAPILMRAGMHLSLIHICIPIRRGYLRLYSFLSWREERMPVCNNGSKIYKQLGLSLIHI